MSSKIAKGLRELTELYRVMVLSDTSSHKKDRFAVFRYSEPDTFFSAEHVSKPGSPGKTTQQSKKIIGVPEWFHYDSYDNLQLFLNEFDIDRGSFATDEQYKAFRDQTYPYFYGFMFAREILRSCDNEYDDTKAKHRYVLLNYYFNL